MNLYDFPMCNNVKQINNEPVNLTSTIIEWSMISDDQVLSCGLRMGLL